MAKDLQKQVNRIGNNVTKINKWIELSFKH